MERRRYSTTVELALRATLRCTHKSLWGAGPERPIVAAIPLFARYRGLGQGRDVLHDGRAVPRGHPDVSAMAAGVVVPERVAWIVRDARGELAARGTRQGWHVAGSGLAAKFGAPPMVAGGTTHQDSAVHDVLDGPHGLAAGRAWHVGGGWFRRWLVHVSWIIGRSPEQRHPRKPLCV